jgi:hypothetical protein
MVTCARESTHKWQWKITAPEPCQITHVIGTRRHYLAALTCCLIPQLRPARIARHNMYS